MAHLALAQALVSCVPFHFWRKHLGHWDPARGRRREEAGALAADVRWAAKRLPFESKCLPQAMALSWMLRRKDIGHAVVFAVQRPNLPNSPDLLHCWVEVEGQTVLGQLDGMWTETLRLEGQPPHAPTKAN